MAPGSVPAPLPSEALSYGPLSSASSTSGSMLVHEYDGMRTPRTPVAATHIVNQAMQHEEAALLSDPLVLRSLNH